MLTNSDEKQDKITIHLTKGDESFVRADLISFCLIHEIISAPYYNTKKGRKLTHIYECH